MCLSDDMLSLVGTYRLVRYHCWCGLLSWGYSARNRVLSVMHALGQRPSKCPLQLDRRSQVIFRFPFSITYNFVQLRLIVSSC